MSFGLGGDFDLFSVFFFFRFLAALFCLHTLRIHANWQLALSFSPLASVLGRLGRRDILIIHFDFCAAKQRVAKWGIHRWWVGGGEGSACQSVWRAG